MASPQPSLDPLRYALRALDEMARAESSVLVPARSDDVVFAPHPLLRPPPRDGAALSLRLFSDAPEDATRFVLRDDDTLSLAPVPARAAAFFEAHAAELAGDGDDELVVGFPLVSFAQQGQRRTAPLLSWSGARAVWRLDDKPWKLPPAVRVGVSLAIPTALVLRAPARDDAAPFVLHTGIWSQLFGLDGQTLAAVAAAGRASVGALTRAAITALTGAEAATDEAAIDAAPPTRDEVRALCDAACARASARHAVKCHPHGVAMLRPRGDPTSGLRTELRALIDGPAPRKGALAVYLGLPSAPARPSPLWTHGASPPTASQFAAAEALEGSRDLVAVCGPPGCGKTTLLHHLAAQAIVGRALDETWVKMPTSSGAPWALVVTSTNNAAVDHALAPFVASRALPVGLRLGNRRTLAEVTAAALRASITALIEGTGPSLPQARAAFESLARPAREHLRALDEGRDARARRREESERLQARAQSLRARLQDAPPTVDSSLALADVQRARETLQDHAHAATRVAPLCLDVADPSVERARARWSDANARRGPVIAPVLARLGMELPYRDLGGDDDVRDALERQHAAMLSTAKALEEVERALRAPKLRRELDEVTASLARLERDDVTPAPPPPSPELVEAALAVRDAWARANRHRLLPLLNDALSQARDEPRNERSRPMPAALAALAGLFPVAGCTLLSLRTSFPLDGGAIDRLVVDEAGQCAPAYAVPALARAARALVTGDTAQLPPVYTVDDRVDDRLARGFDADAVEPFRMGTSAMTSAQAVAEARAPSRLSLVEHFRSQPAIVALASSWSGHTLDVRTPPRSLADVSPLLSAPVIVEDVRGHGGRAPEGVVNEAEAARAITLVESMVRDGVAPCDIAVLTPFVGQSARIERALLRMGLAGEDGALVRTVHRLQGGERRVVVFSVAATERRHLRWLAGRPHLLHVATSRAQDHLLVLLHADRARDEPLLAPLLAPGLRRTPARR